MQKTSLTKRALRFESLETRTLMAGNVTAAINEAGNLEIRGDSKSNVVAVTQFNNGEWKVQGLVGTTINGKSSEKFEYSGGMDVSLGRGNDGFAIVKGDLQGELSIRTSDGIDGVALTRLRAWSIFVHTGADTDAILVAKVTVEAPLTEPENPTSLLQSELGTATFQTSSGDDYVLLAKLTAQSVYVSTHGGRDLVGLLGVSADERLYVNVGEGDFDIVGAVKNSAPIANIHGGGNLADSYFSALNSFEEKQIKGFQFNQSFDVYAQQLESLVETYLPLLKQLPGLGGLPNFSL